MSGDIPHLPSMEAQRELLGRLDNANWEQLDLIETVAEQSTVDEDTVRKAFDRLYRSGELYVVETRYRDVLRPLGDRAVVELPTGRIPTLGCLCPLHRLARDGRTRADGGGA